MEASEYGYPAEGTAFDLSSAARSLVGECLAEARAWGDATGGEAFFAIDAENAAVVLEHRGRQRSVELEPEGLTMLSHCPDRSLVLVHNHPDWPAAHSPSDFDVAVRLPFVRFSAVVASDGSTWWLSVSGTVPWLDRNVWEHGAWKAGKRFKKQCVAAYGPDFARWWGADVEDLMAARDPEVLRGLREVLAEDLVLRLRLVHRLEVGWHAFRP